MELDSATSGAFSPPPLVARGPFPPQPPSVSFPRNRDVFKLASGWGGARVGAGRPRKPRVGPVARDGFHWYVVRTRAGEIVLADREIREADFLVFAPMIFKLSVAPRRLANGSIRPGKPDRVEFLLVRYIIVSMDVSDPSWRRILTLPGVERVISGGHAENGGVGIPIPVRDDAIDWLRSLLDAGDIIDPRVHREPRIAVGAELVLTGGPLPDHAGVCAMSDGQRVVLLMSLFNRPGAVRAHVSQASVAAVAK